MSRRSAARQSFGTCRVDGSTTACSTTSVPRVAVQNRDSDADRQATIDGVAGPEQFSAVVGLDDPPADGAAPDGGTGVPGCAGSAPAQQGEREHRGQPAAHQWKLTNPHTPALPPASPRSRAAAAGCHAWGSRGCC